ncbi:hypothetical protein ACHWQZ_G002946 [Mnemiopsis leidyi]
MTFPNHQVLPKIPGMPNTALLSTCLLLTTVNSSYHTRISNIYFSVYLNSTLHPSRSPTYFLYQDNATLLTRDSDRSLCVNSTKQLDLCDSSLGSVWVYEGDSLALYTVLGTDKFYLKMDGSSAGLTRTQSDKSDQILLVPAVGNTDKPVSMQLKEMMASLDKDLDSVRQKFGELSAQKDRMLNASSVLADKAKKSEEDYEKFLKSMTDKVKEFEKEMEDMKKEVGQEIQDMNNTQYNWRDNVLPSLLKKIEGSNDRPAQFMRKLDATDLEDYLFNETAEIEKTLKSYLNKHRTAPISMYDWMIIVTTLLYVVYFVDIVGRAAGWKFLVRKNTNRTEIEMEAPSNIQPEYFLQEEAESSTFEYARARESIKGKLRLKPVE